MQHSLSESTAVAAGMYARFNALTWHRITFQAALHANGVPVALFQAVIEGAYEDAFGLGSWESARVTWHIRNRSFTHSSKSKSRLTVDVVFFGMGPADAEWYHAALRQRLDRPDTADRMQLHFMGEVEVRCGTDVLKMFAGCPEWGELCLEFLGPFYRKIFPVGKNRIFLDQEDFISGCVTWFERMFNTSLPYDGTHDDFYLIPCYGHYDRLRHPSASRSRGVQMAQGYCGPLYLRGHYAGLLPYILLGSEIHVGYKRSFCMGYYRLFAESRSFFDRYFPDKQAMDATWRDIEEKYDGQTCEQLTPIDTEMICKQIRNSTYIFSAGQSFPVEKKAGGVRYVEQLTLADLLVEKYVLATINKWLDHLLEEESIGYRKGLSREQAIGMIRAAAEDGYRFALETDVEDFFPSVDLTIMADVIDRWLPRRDVLVRAILMSAIRKPYRCGDREYDRHKGLAQGSPLSGLLTNLYLDSLDEHVKTMDVRLIRYADDVVMLTRTRADAEKALAETESELGRLGLHIKEEKTAIHPIGQAFEFLGYRFVQGQPRRISRAGADRMRKPLYITEPWLFIALRDDTLSLIRDKHVLHTFPLRRISEIIILGNATFSTALVRKCVENAVPIIQTTTNGYFINTIRPDSRKWFDIAHRQAQRFEQCSEAERIQYARQIAINKLRGYITLLQSRRQVHAVKQLRHAIDGIRTALTPDEVRGYEGAAARKVFHVYNHIIQFPAFHIRTRTRRNPDRINSLLNFTYYLLFTRMNALLRVEGLNPYLGFLHSPINNYESLACDIEELFRARIDRFVIRSINLKIIQESDFTETENGCWLKDNARKHYLRFFEAEMQDTHPTHPEREEYAAVHGAGNGTLLELMHEQCKMIRRWAVNQEPLSFYFWAEQHENEEFDE